MICRKLIKNDITGKQNIVWFGSYGKNLNYIPMNFTLDQNNVPVNWRVNYSTYYIITSNNGEPYLNTSPIWGSDGIYPSNSLLPNNDLYPKETIQGVSYFKKENNVFIPVKTIPDDWPTNYMNYYIIEFELNNSLEYDPNKTYYAHDNKLDAGENYSKNQQGVRDSLIQRLSIIKGELWYKASYGLPLTEKIKNKGIYDSIIINIITEHPDVKNILEYNSSVDKNTRKYTFNFIVYTVYNEEVSVSYII